MKYCRFCGQELEDQTMYCPTCGGKQDGANNEQTVNSAYGNPSMPDNKKKENSTMYLVAFIFMIISCLTMGWMLIPLAWLIPMTLSTYKAYKGEKKVSVGMAVCMLIFANIISGVICLVADNK